ncbi:hypothetical protein V6N11_077837 [Hibiscus sabdariffa]|uniref:RNase H type-1 domain-containing protein n=1 Tax=Hibiscus sabdariffa TaxID=183260 RepID=A0ABR2TEC5_9ROSI
MDSPPPGVIKVNSDSSFDASLNIAGIAAVLRDSVGSIIGGANRRVVTSSITTAEALVCRLGLKAAILHGWDSIIVKSDNDGLISRLNSKSSTCWESNSVEKDVIFCLIDA